MNSQKGIALIVSLVVLVVAALLGLSSYQASQLEERMAGNHRFSVSALQGAEVGVNKVLGAVVSYTYTPGNEFCNNLSTSLSGSGFEPDGPGYYDSGEVLGGDLNVRYKAYMECDGDGHLVGYSRGAVLGVDGGDDVEELSARRVRFEIIPPGFDSINSMLAEGEIRITGNSTVVGNVHSNDKVDISIKETGDPKDRLVSRGSITAVNEVDVGGKGVSEGAECEDVVCAAANAPRQEVPSAEEAIIAVQDAFLAQALVSDEGVVPEIYEWVASSESNLSDIDNHVTVLEVDGSNNCLVPESGFLTKSESLDYSENDTSDESKASGSNHVYYCPGDLTTGVDFVGVTVVAEGDITHSGAMTINADDDRESFVIAGGNITLNGSTNPNNPTPTYATFLSGGDFVQTGNSTISGAVVSEGIIDIRGGVTFIAKDTGKLFRPVSGHLEGWVELEDPAEEDDITKA